MTFTVEGSVRIKTIAAVTTPIAVASAKNASNVERVNVKVFLIQITSSE